MVFIRSTNKWLQGALFCKTGRVGPPVVSKVEKKCKNFIKVMKMLQYYTVNVNFRWVDGVTWKQTVNVCVAPCSCSSVCVLRLTKLDLNSFLCTSVLLCISGERVNASHVVYWPGQFCFPGLWSPAVAQRLESLHCMCVCVSAHTRSDLLSFMVYCKVSISSFCLVATSRTAKL